MKSDHFRGKSVVITGGNSGMGRAITHAFVASGARVVVGDVSGEPPADAVYQQTDVSQSNQVRELIERAVSLHGRIDILVNNAGINGALVPLAEQTEADIDAAVVSLTRSAAHEYGQYGIRVVAVAPGPIDTPMLRRADPDGRIIDSVPLHRIGSGEDIANAVLWLASDAAAYVSGSLLTVDGAFLAA